MDFTSISGAGVLRPLCFLSFAALPYLGSVAGRRTKGSNPSIGAAVGLVLHFGVFMPVGLSLITGQWDLRLEHFRLRDLLAAVPGAEWTAHARLWAATSITLAAAGCSLIASALATLAMLSPRRRKPLLRIAAILALPLAHPLVGWNGMLPVLFGALNFVAPMVFIMEAQSSGSVRRAFRSANAALSIDLADLPARSVRGARRPRGDPRPSSAGERCRRR